MNALTKRIGSLWIVALTSACLLLHCSARAGDLAFDSTHWSLDKRSTPAIPRFSTATDQQWVRNSLDAFILARLKRAGLSPASPADRRTLVRRLYFDLTGLPPTPEKTAAFLNDKAPDAYERLVDRLLASPRYGERWGQHWLDVVRFAETEGFEYDRHRVGAWRYRDFVIRSFNEDKPYDQFVLEQLAGDELPRQDQQGLIAAGFHRLGPVRRNAGNQSVAYSRNEVLTDRTDAVGSVFLGLTIGCARCHDHKFDPILQTDYYHLQAFLAASFESDVPLVDEAEQDAWKARYAAAKKEIDDLKTALENASEEEKAQLEARLMMAKLELPNPLPSLCSVKNDTKQRTAIHLLKRGDASKPLQRLGMRPPEVLLPEGTPELPPETKDPRTRLARWIVQPEHPLTARVMVNRIWQWHFGRGIVTTPNDFGMNGEPPSHPELLDWLANRFVAGGWRMKPIHRLILLSATYRQSSRAPSADRAKQKDPENQLLWQFRRRRLEAEEIRDTMLFVAGVLNAKRGGPSVIVPVEAELVDLLYDPLQWSVTENSTEHYRRSAYLIAKRNLRLPFMDVFDQPDLQLSCDRRASSTHAPQALELLNGRISNQLASAFAKRLQRASDGDPNRLVERAFLLATGWPPTEPQRRLALAFVKEQPLREFALAMFNLNALLYVD